MMHVVITSVKIFPDKADEMIKFFQETNPKFVESQEEWISTKLTFNNERDEATVIAFWKTGEAYLSFKESPGFQSAMSGFSQFINGKPDIKLNEIVFATD